MATVLTGQLLAGRYAIGRRLGQGGMAVVYQAIDQQTGRAVAVKALHESYAADQDGRRRFAVEARAAAKLRHPQIVRSLAYSLADPPFIVYEYVDGPDLKDYLRWHGPLSVAATIAIVEQVAAALDHAHQAGIVHRDIKPQNILVSGDQPAPEPREVTERLDGDEAAVPRKALPPDRDTSLTAKVTDFGIARSIDATSQTTRGVIFGSVAYLAPEQIAGEKATPASDIYGLGAVAYELLAGRPPFAAESPYGILGRKLREAAPGFRRERPDIPAAIEPVLLAALNRKPRRRPATAGDFAAQLRAAGQGYRRAGWLPFAALLSPENLPGNLPGIRRERPPGGQGAARPSRLRRSLPRGTEVLRLGRLHLSAQASSLGTRIGPRLRHRGPGRIPLGALIAPLVLLILAGTVLALQGDSTGAEAGRVRTPNLVGQPLGQARDTARQSDGRLVEGTSRPDEQAPREEVGRGSAITATTSLGPAEPSVPALIDLSLDQARQAIESAGLQVGEIGYEPGSAPGRILNQEPPAGQAFSPGTPINLTVASSRPEEARGAAPAGGPATGGAPPATTAPTSTPPAWAPAGGPPASPNIPAQPQAPAPAQTRPSDEEKKPEEKKPEEKKPEEKKPEEKKPERKGRGGD